MEEEVFFIIIFLLFWLAIMVGVFALFVWACGRMAESKGLPKTYKWFGLLGVIGIIIIAVSNPTYPQFPTYTQYPPQNGYGQNTYPPQNGYTQNPQQNTYFGNNPYQQQTQQFQQQSVKPQQAAPISYCPHCGAKIDGYSISCSNCGQMLR